jgi:hypothetical protein
MNTNSDTPETDSEARSFQAYEGEMGIINFVRSDFARRLERERDDARKWLRLAFNALRMHGVPEDRARSAHNGINVLVSRMDKQVADLERERNELRERVAELEPDAELGKQWHKDSSLARWFPYTAEAMARLEARVAELEAVRGEPVATLFADGCWIETSTEAGHRLACELQIAGRQVAVYTAPPAVDVDKILKLADDYADKSVYCNREDSNDSESADDAREALSCALRAIFNNAGTAKGGAP